MATARKITSIVLAKGAHSNPDQGMCAMEAVAWLAGEPHSDHPECASPVLASYVRVLNDNMPDEQRQRLKPYLRKLLNTRDETLEQERANVLAWASITVFAPTCLHLIGLVDHAEILKKVPKYDWKAAEAAAESAARSAAESAAESAARSAARSAAESAAESAVEAAAARSAAWSAVEAAAASDKPDVWGLAIAVLEQAIAIKRPRKKKSKV